MKHTNRSNDIKQLTLNLHFSYFIDLLPNNLTAMSHIRKLQTCTQYCLLLDVLYGKISTVETNYSGYSDFCFDFSCLLVQGHNYSMFKVSIILNKLYFYCLIVLKDIL